MRKRNAGLTEVEYKNLTTMDEQQIEDVRAELSRRNHMRTAHARMSAFATTATTAYESALKEADSLGLAQHPIIDDLRRAILDGKRILARSAELGRRIP